MWSLPGRLRNPAEEQRDAAGAPHSRSGGRCWVTALSSIVDGCTRLFFHAYFSRFMTQRIVGLKDRRNQNGLGRRALGFCVVRVVAERSSNRWGRGRKSRLCDALRL